MFKDLYCNDEHNDDSFSEQKDQFWLFLWSTFSTWLNYSPWLWLGKFPESSAGKRLYVTISDRINTDEGTSTSKSVQWIIAGGN